jgi:hypothetical protein
MWVGEWSDQRGYGLLQTWKAKEEKIDQTNTQKHKDFNVENPSDEKGKKHVRQPSKLHYMWESLPNVTVSRMQRIPCGGLQERYIYRSSRQKLNFTF